MTIDELIAKLKEIRETSGNLEVQCNGEMCGDGNYQIIFVEECDELDEHLDETGKTYCELWMEYLPRNYRIPNSDENFNNCLPCEWVKEPEKKYRPYTLAEWVDQHEIGEVIHCRNEHKQEFHVMYTGYVIDNGEEDIQDNRTTGRIMLINMGYLLQELFERYEICINGSWQPFGVMEDD